MNTDIKKLLNKRDNSKLFEELKQSNNKKIDPSMVLNMRTQARSDLDMWRSLLETAYHYAVPSLNPFENYGQGGEYVKGQQYNGDVYDLTLPIAHKRLADKMLMGMVPQGQQWVSFKPGDAFGEEDSPEYARALEATQRMTDNFFKILNRSNFYLATSESLSDVLISTGVMAVNEGTRKKPLRFEAVPQSQVMFRGNAYGEVDAVFRDWEKVRVETIKTMWPDAKPELLRKDGHVSVKLHECAYIDYEAPEDRQYKYCVIADDKTCIYENESSSWPWIIYRMRKMVGETRGRGPSLEALPTAATINIAVRDELISAAFTANPMYMASSDSAFNHYTFEPIPGTVIPVQMVMGQWPIQPLPAGGNIQFSQLIINDFREQINNLMYAFPLGSVSAPDRTATEAEIRYTENLESFSAMVPRLQNEFFTPVIERSLWVINKILPETFAGIPDDIRQKLLSVDGQIMGLTYETPLMTAQGKIKTSNLIKWYQDFSALVGQEAATAALQPDNVALSLAENQGVDLKNIKSKNELEQQVQAAGEMAQDELEQQGIDI